MGNAKEDNSSLVHIVDTTRAERFKDELNFAEFPLASLADHIPAEQKTLTFTDIVFDQGANRPVTRKLTIAASDQYGLPKAKDEEVILGLIQLSNRQGFADRKAYFSSYELIKLLGWKDTSYSYMRIEEALNRWISITLFYDKAWWSKEDKCWVNEKFHILDSITIFDKERREIQKKLKPGDPNAGRSYFVWNEKVFQSFKAENLKEIDLEVFTALKSSVSKRMYRFLDKHFYNRARLEYDLKIFAHEKIGISRTSTLSQVKRQLVNPILELEAIGFIKPMAIDERFRKIKKGVHRVIFERGQTEAKNLMSLEESQVFDELRRREVSAGKASKLVRNYTLDRVMEKIAYHDWLVASKDKRCSSNPAGFLVNAIEEDYPAPKGFLKSREEAKAQLTVISRSQAHQKPPSGTTQQHSTGPSEGDLMFLKWFEELTENELVTIEQEALKLTDKFSQKHYHEGKQRGGTLFNAIRKKIFREYFEKTQLIAAK